jgi:hypothetical protein
VVSEKPTIPDLLRAMFLAPSKVDTIKYIYTNLQHKNPLCRVIPIDSTYGYESERLNYDKEKYKEMIVDAVESVLGYLVLTGLSMETRKM